MDIKSLFKLNLHKKIAFPFISAVLIIFVAAYFLLEARENRLILDAAYCRARTAFKMIVLTRQWMAERRNKIKPIAAVATKELSDHARQLSDIRFHIISDRSINPSNAPDEFEKAAMKQFKRGKKEVYEIVDTKKGKIYRYMAPLFINKACRSCHIHQGYRIYNFRGGISISVPLSPIYGSISKNRKILLGLIIAAGLLLLILVKLLITKLVLIPVKKLDRAAAKISQGDYDIDIQIQNNDELGNLAKTFINMSRKISLSQTVLQERIKNATERLNAANEKLSKIAERKSELYSALAHDIRTPLAVIILGAETIETKLNKTENTEIVEAIKNNAKSLKALFDNLLEIEKIEDGILKIHPQKQEINFILREIVNELAPFAKHSGITLIFDSDKELEAVVDKDKLAVCLQNIILNAIKFSPAGKEIRVESYKVQNTVVVEISDQGIGIAPDEIDKIFNKFYRTKRGRHKYRYGSGLGLTIAKKFVEGMNGKIYVASELKKGTKIKIVLQSA